MSIRIVLDRNNLSKSYIITALSSHTSQAILVRFMWSLVSFKAALLQLPSFF